jgi:O-antigen/teichoic acid export membrane protein
LNPKRLSFTVIKNAAANVLRGGASAIVALALPPLLIRHLNHDRFAAWSILLQFAAYVNFLDFGLQTAVSRFVARTVEQGYVDKRNRLISTAFAMLVAAAALACLIMLGLIPLLPSFFPTVPPALLRELQRGVLCLSLLSALALPASAFTGVLIGLQRNELTAVALGTAKILGAVSLALLVTRSSSLVWMAAVIGVWNLVGAASQFGMIRNLLPQFHLSFRLASRAEARELLHYCAYLTIWIFGGFLVSGLDVALVGHFEFRATGSYAIATSVVNLLGALSGAVFGAMLPAASVIHTRGEFRKLGLIVLRTTRYGIYFLAFSIFPILVAGPFLLKKWLNAEYAAQTLPFLVVLLAANAIRLAGYPYSVVMIGSGQHKHNVIGPFAEGFVNLFASILLAMRMGAIGVALGTLLGSFVGVAFHIFYNLPRTREIEMSRSEYAIGGLLFPFVRMLPLFLCGIVAFEFPRRGVSLPATIATIVGLTLSSALWALRNEEYSRKKPEIP